MISKIQDRSERSFQRLPAWFQQEIPDSTQLKVMKAQFRARNLSTVCESARCPNQGQCWGRGVATFMILGSVCTRACRFCGVASGRPGPVDFSEPENLAEMIRDMGLTYAVITSVTRDDLDDQGSVQFARTVRAVRRINPQIKIELLIPDFSGRLPLLQTVVDAAPDVLAHNIEMCRRLFPDIRPQAEYDRSLNVLSQIKRMDPYMIVKSGFMVGLGETDGDVLSLMRDLRRHGCDMLTIGQYLPPSQGFRHVRVQRFVSPEMFKAYEQWAGDLGFRHVLSGPLVRSSYIAESGFYACRSAQTS